MENVKSLIVAGIIILVIVAGGIFFYSRGSNSKVPVQTSAKQTITQSSQQAAPAKSGQDITLTANGFSPNSVTIKAGTRVKWTNNSGTVGDVDSDPHPVHTSYPPMNFGQFSNGSSVELVLDKPGTYHYHNHLNSSQTGTIIVQ